MPKQTVYENKKITLNKKVGLFVIAIILLASTLRSPLTAVGPITSFIRDALSISNGLVGFLTTIPLLAFAVVSPFTPKIARRFGMELTLFYSIVLLTSGIIIRSIGTVQFLFIGTLFIGIAIAFGNVLIPSFFKLKFPLHIGILTGIYTVAMNLSSGMSAGISYPIAQTMFGWQGALGASAIVAIIAILFWLPLLRDDKLSLTQSIEKKLEWAAFFRSPLAWAIMLSMGLQSFIFYTTAAWIPEIYIAQGVESSQAGWLVSIMQISQIPLTFLTPLIAVRLKNQRPIALFFTLCYLISFIGILAEWTEFAVVWMIFLGFAGGASFGLVMMLFTLRTNTAYEAAELSGFSQSLGYLLAAIGPTSFGIIKDVTGSFFISNSLFIILTIILFVTSSMSSGNKKIRP